MTTAEGWTGAVRARLGLGRLLPLGTAADGAWLAERAAEPVLRRAAGKVPGVVPGGIRAGLADPGAAGTPTVPPPPAALPPGPLRIEADFAAAAAVPLPELAELLRAALFAAAREHLGLAVAVVDLRVTALLDAPPEAAGAPGPGPVGTSVVARPAAARPQEAETDGADRADGARPADSPRGPGHPAAADAKGTESAKGTVSAESAGETREPGHPSAAGAKDADGAGEPRGGAGAGETRDVIAAAAAAAPGVARLTGTLGAAVRADASSVRVECATAPGHRPVEVARAVRAAVTSVLPSPLPVTVLVTEVGPGE
ncbi:hypothetical protein [Streptomyces sp. WMMC940]|uniref:hypothetical protein n=1 Tax=Streptomyces sp. WMMC940 TaxID=3015153 RepID=UPI0022B6698B|nr:hypothetical protein [Streptomyces sp. WMMC940]MCZ7461099.1 hypothetical protein [Streptomyces sp. WMMC940]